MANSWYCTPATHLAANRNQQGSALQECAKLLNMRRQYDAAGCIPRFSIWGHLPDMERSRCSVVTRSSSAPLSAILCCGQHSHYALSVRFHPLRPLSRSRPNSFARNISNDGGPALYIKFVNYTSTYIVQINCFILCQMLVFPATTCRG